MNLDERYWQKRYEQNLTQWDAGAITPPLKQYADQIKDRQKKILIPGCGQAYEAEYLHQRGFTQVCVADLALFPLQRLKERVPDFPKDHLLHQDFFSLGGRYDLILEQTFFCALPPDLRPAYSAQCAALLRPGGQLVGVLFETIFDQEGPPFGGDREEYKRYFSSYFDFKVFDRCYNSLGPRQGRELFILLQKKDSPPSSG
ncbi:methyltransferase domain-containing protein [soil metagenome]